MKSLGLFLALVLQLVASVAYASPQTPVLGPTPPALDGHNDEDVDCRTRLKLEADRAAGDKLHEGIDHALLGLLEAKGNRADNARMEWSIASRMLEKSGDPFGAWMTRWLLANLEFREGSTEVALQEHEQALALLDAAATSRDFSLETFKAMGALFGAPVEMLAPLDSMPGLVKPLLLAFAESLCRDSYGAVLIEVSRLDDAEVELTRALQAGSLFGGAFDASIQAHLGDLRRRQWRFDEAEESYRKALDGAHRMPLIAIRNESVESGIYAKLAELELLRGRLDAAVAWNDRALALTREAHNPSGEAWELSRRADLFIGAGRFDEAEAALLQAQSVAEHSGSLLAQANALSDLGLFYMLAGRQRAAARNLERSLELFDKLHESYLEAATWPSLIEVYLMMDADDAAKSAVERGLAIARQSDFPAAERMIADLQKVLGTTSQPERVELLTQAIAHLQQSAFGQTVSSEKGLDGFLREITGVAGQKSASPGESKTPGLPLFAYLGAMQKGQTLLQNGSPAEARAVWTTALATASNADMRIALLAGIAATYVAEGKLDEASSAMDKATSALEEAAGGIDVDELLTTYLGGFRHIYFDALIDVQSARGKVAEAFAVTERARARAFLQLVGNRRLAPRHPADAPLVAEAESLRLRIATWEQEEARAHSASVESDLRQARTRYDGLMQRIRAMSPEYAAMTRIEPVALDKIQAELPADTALVSYFIGVRNVHAWVVQSGGIEHVLLPVSGAVLQRAICWADHLGRGRMARGSQPDPTTCDPAPTAEELYTALFAPLRPNLRATRLIVVPHGVLHYIPFAALRDPRSGRYLVEDFTITYAPSASTIPFLRAKESPVDGKALILGDPDGTLPKLEGAKAEAQAIARLFGTQAKIGAEATESVLFDLHGGVDLLHIAAHGHYDDANPLFSYLDLSPGGGRNGKLEAHEILADLDLSGVNLVVLSACETALGKRSGGDEIVGLTRAFLYAGTPGLISTLWNIRDEATARLMQHFYERLSRGDTAAEALRSAQLAMLHSADEIDRDPTSWAAFTLTGDPQGRWHTAP